MFARRRRMRWQSPSSTHFSYSVLHSRRLKYSSPTPPPLMRLLTLYCFVGLCLLVIHAAPPPPEMLSQARAVVGILDSFQPPITFADVKNISIAYVDIPNHKYRVDAVTMNLTAPELGITTISSTVWRFDLLEQWTWENTTTGNVSSSNCTSQQLNATAEPVFPDWSNYSFVREASCVNPDSSTPPLCFYWQSGGATFIDTSDYRTPVAYIDIFTVYIFAVFVAGPIGPLAFAKTPNCVLAHDNRFLTDLLQIRKIKF